MKPANSLPLGMPAVSDIPSRPGQTVAMDFIGPLPMTQRGHYILTFIDTFTGLLTATPLTSSDATPLGARETAEAFIREVVRYRGLPDIIMSARDSRSLSAFWQELHRALPTKLKIVTIPAQTQQNALIALS